VTQEESFQSSTNDDAFKYQDTRKKNIIEIVVEISGFSYFLVLLFVFFTTYHPHLVI